MDDPEIIVAKDGVQILFFLQKAKRPPQVFHSMDEFEVIYIVDDPEILDGKDGAQMGFSSEGYKTPQVLYSMDKL